MARIAPQAQFSYKLKLHDFVTQQNELNKQLQGIKKQELRDHIY